MVFDEKGKSLELLFKGTKTGLLTWGFEYLNQLSGEIAREFEKRYATNRNERFFANFKNRHSTF